ncbi:MAG: FkbM family methyltransferase [Dysgonamonadaceae bacterium]|jgi:FkbM family methyltransferase|nr:FkbM family methyltransferase [Dysgonamonadaceae bacterium]
MLLIKNTWTGLRHKHWTLFATFTYFLKGIARETNILSNFFLEWHRKTICRQFKKKWLKQYGEICCFDFNGAKFPDISADKDNFLLMTGSVFEDTFFIPCYYDDNYDKTLVERLDRHMNEGPYGYIDGTFDVTVRKNDVVIDAGAWLGDFSAYAASKNATCYAFEPVAATFRTLCETAELNKSHIFPVQKGLGSEESQLDISVPACTSASSFIMFHENGQIETIQITTLDKFVEENKLSKIDFIKADIEGAERDMLLGATNVLKTFAPKLAICTYHLPDDPEVLEKIILDANPDYTVRHLRHKLFAMVIK